MTQTNRDSPSTQPHDIEALPVREVAPGAPWRW